MTGRQNLRVTSQRFKPLGHAAFLKWVSMFHTYVNYILQIILENLSVQKAVLINRSVLTTGCFECGDQITVHFTVPERWPSCLMKPRDGYPHTVREVEIINMRKKHTIRAIISTSLTVGGQPFPRFHVKAWLPFRNRELNGLLLALAWSHELRFRLRCFFFLCRDWVVSSCSQ